VGKWRRRGLRAPFCHGGRFCGQKSPPAKAGGSSSTFASKEMEARKIIKLRNWHPFNDNDHNVQVVDHNGNDD